MPCTRKKTCLPASVLSVLFVLGVLRASCPAVGGGALAPGERLFDSGDFEGAIREWRRALPASAEQLEPELVAQSLLRQAAACHETGRHKLAMDLLERAEGFCGGGPGSVLRLQIKALRGVASAFSRQSAEAEPLLREVILQARQGGEWDLYANALCNLGGLLVSRGEYEGASACFTKVLAKVSELGRADLEAVARKGSVEVWLGLRAFSKALQELERMERAVSKLEASHAKASLWLAAAHLREQLFYNALPRDDGMRLRAFRCGELALAAAEAVGDARVQSGALGHQALLLEGEARYAEAASLAGRALFLAQRAQAVDLVYRLQWQCARLAAKEARIDEAIELYRIAVSTLQSVRNDVAIRHGNSNARSSFREAAGGLYLELADLLLRKADRSGSAVAAQALLREARDTAEQLKSAELEDYFQDDCVNRLRSKQKQVQGLDSSALVVYVIPLPDRTEILVGSPDGQLVRRKSEVGEVRLRETVRQFRLNLEDRTTNEFLEQSRNLYDWLVRPWEEEIQRHGCRTLVFVPDGALRTVPMAALHDGVRFLVEKVAVAVTPGLELMESRPSLKGGAKVMLGGLSESVQGFAPLAHVPGEIANLQKLYPGSRSLTDKTFSKAAISTAILTGEFSVVHIASHGVFNQDIRKSFVLTHDARLTLDDLERCIRPAQLRDQPLEMLALSACQTAVGDDRAALGLAGVAVKAGARSAFASLWFVNDEAASKLVGAFYAKLAGGDGAGRAAALQDAQKSLLAQERYKHPCYWAPFLILGNWL
jgi:CHAT domain-containing protein